MGRKKKYQTEEELIEAKRKWRKDWYEKNKVEYNVRRMEKYYEQKRNKVDSKLS